MTTTKHYELTDLADLGKTWIQLNYRDAIKRRLVAADIRNEAEAWRAVEDIYPILADAALFRAKYTLRENLRPRHLRLGPICITITKSRLVDEAIWELDELFSRLTLGAIELLEGLRP